MAVNPLGLQGQVEGGVMMGLGNCLTEEFIVENGYVVTDHLAVIASQALCSRRRSPRSSWGIPLRQVLTGRRAWERSAASQPHLPLRTELNAVGVRVDKLPVDQEMIAREIWEREEQ